jgi:hypothetical protein
LKAFLRRAGCVISIEENEKEIRRICMGYIILILVVVGLLSLIISYFKQDKIKQVEDQIEGTSITMMQELYQIKKKLRILEEEVLIENRNK